MNAAAYPECDLCTFRHGPGPCLVPRDLPMGIDGEALGFEHERVKVSRRAGKIAAARQHERALARDPAARERLERRAVKRREANERRLEAIRRASFMRGGGLEKAARKSTGRKPC